VPLPHDFCDLSRIWYWGRKTEPGQDKTNAIEHYSPPKSVHQVRQFLGLAFCKGFCYCEAANQSHEENSHMALGCTRRGAYFNRQTTNGEQKCQLI
jgi:hypothetical protein